MWMPSVYRTDAVDRGDVETGTSSSVAGQLVGSRPPGSARPEQDVGERVAVLLAAEPGQQHGRHLVAPRHQHRRARS